MRYDEEQGRDSSSHQACSPMDSHLRAWSGWHTTCVTPRARLPPAATCPPPCSSAAATLQDMENAYSCPDGLYTVACGLSAALPLAGTQRASHTNQHLPPLLVSWQAGVHNRQHAAKHAAALGNLRVEAAVAVRKSAAVWCKASRNTPLQALRRMTLLFLPPHKQPTSQPAPHLRGGLVWLAAPPAGRRDSIRPCKSGWRCCCRAHQRRRAS